MRGAPIALLVFVAAPSTANGDCHADASAWLVGRGELSADRGCGLLLTTDAEDHSESLGDVRWQEPVELPYELELRWQRLDPGGGRTLWLTLIGGDLLFKTGSIAWYVDPAQLRRDGYRRIPGLSSHDEHRFSVRQTAELVELKIDGRLRARIPFHATKRRGHVGIGFNGARAYRAVLRFADFVVRAGAQ